MQNPSIVPSRINVPAAGAPGGGHGPVRHCGRLYVSGMVGRGPAGGGTTVLLHTPSPCSKEFNGGAEGASAK